MPRVPIALWLVVVLAVTGAGSPRAATDKAPFDELAGQLLSGLADARADSAPLRVAIWPFDNETSPVSPELGREYNGRLLARLLARVRKSGGATQVRFIEREELGTIIKEVRETSVFDDVGNPVAALLESARVDVLIIGRLRAVSNRSTDLILVYRAVRVADGEDIAVTTGGRLVGAIKGARPGVALEQAIARAVEVLSDAAPDMKELRLGGISYQATGVQTSAGPYIEEQIGIALQRAYRNVISERSLIVKQAELTEDDIARLRKQDSNEGGEIQTALLRRTIWDFGPSLELRLVLRSRGATISRWRGFVRRDPLPPGLRIAPEGHFGALADNLPGPIAIELSSRRGRTPRYEVGEQLHLLVRTSRATALYCFYLQANRRLLKIFPNPEHAQANLGAGLHEIPGNLFRFNFVISEPPGIELIKCFAASRDVTAMLPSGLRANSLKPLPVGTEWDLARIFSGLKGVGLTEVSLVVTVDRPN